MVFGGPIVSRQVCITLILIVPVFYFLYRNLTLCSQVIRFVLQSLKLNLYGFFIPFCRIYPKSKQNTAAAWCRLITRKVVNPSRMRTITMASQNNCSRINLPTQFTLHCALFVRFVSFRFSLHFDNHASPELILSSYVYLTLFACSSYCHS